MSENGTSEIFLNNLEKISCVICFNDINHEELCITNCGHNYCLDCLKTWFQRENISCPFCRQDIDHFFKNNEKNNIIKVTINNQNNNNKNAGRNNISCTLFSTYKRSW